MKGIWHKLFQGKILTIMWCCRKLSLLWCLGCNWGEERLRGKEIRKGKKERILKNIVAQSEKKIVFYFVFVQYDVRQVWWDLIKTWMLFWRWPQILAVFRNFCSVWVWLGWLGKNWMCVWALTCGRKRCFDRHLFWLIICVCKFFFLDCVGFSRCNVCCNLCMRWSICLHERWFHCSSVLWCLRGF